MGSGPVVHLASIRNPGAVILMSAFTSIKRAVNEKFGFISSIIPEQFDNLSICHLIQSPTLVIHGKKDNLIGYKHACELYNAMNCAKELVLHEDMNHNDVSFVNHFLEPLKKFMASKCMVKPLEKPRQLRLKSFPCWYFVDQDCEWAFRRERMRNNQKKHKQKLLDNSSPPRKSKKLATVVEEEDHENPNQDVSMSMKSIKSVI